MNTAEMGIFLSKERGSSLQRPTDVDKASIQHPPLSCFGDPQQRQYLPLLSGGLVGLVCAIQVLSSLLPLLVVLLALLLYYKVISSLVVTTVFGLVVVDYLIPLPNGLRPSPCHKLAVDRMAAEIAQLYLPGRSLFLPKNLSPYKSYILACWPHGLLGGGSHLGFYDFDRRGFYPVYSGASVMRYIPFFHRVLCSFGFVEVTKNGLRKVLDVRTHGSTYPYNIVHLLVGGIEEIFCTPMGAEYEQIVVARHKGFIKLALGTGCDIIPMYTFGANQLYARMFGPHSLLCKLSSKLRVALVFWFGRWWIPFGILPFPVPLLTVVGEIFEVPKVKEEEITDELVQSVHSDFCQALRSLYNQYRRVYVEEMGADPSWLTRELRFEDE